MSADLEPIRVVKRPAGYCLLSRASFRGEADAASTIWTELKLQPSIALVGSLFEFRRRRACKFDLIALKEHLDREGAAGPSLASGAVTREGIQWFSNDTVSYLPAQTAAFMNFCTSGQGGLPTCDGDQLRHK
ncbi:MAG TPA: hypothetical protein VMX97_07830 [Hyphomicrobiaceae bacterium]|nr:hypothetical protein [Hyphomicrobiaceae bacterium]